MVVAIFRLYLPPLDEEFRIKIKKNVQIFRFFLYFIIIYGQKDHI